MSEGRAEPWKGTFGAAFGVLRIPPPRFSRRDRDGLLGVIFTVRECWRMTDSGASVRFP
jgi:hypothetical protein